MYGLILQNLVEYIRNKHGDNIWLKLKEQLNIDKDSFAADDTYPEAQVGKMGKAAMKLLGMKEEEFYEGMGKGSYFNIIEYFLGFDFSCW